VKKGKVKESGLLAGCSRVFVCGGQQCDTVLVTVGTDWTEERYGAP
jgi:hypothetical protein